MKKLFLFAGALVAMASCAKNEIQDVNVGNPDVIQVSTYVGQSTKGAIFDQDAVKNSGFGIMAYYTEQGQWSDQAGFAPNFMYNQEVTYNGSAWQYSPLKYWPNEENDKISFFTYAPYPDGKNGVNPVTKNDSEGLPQTEFTLADDAANMIDFVAGQNMNLVRQKDKVVFNMKHQLTRVQFSAKAVVDNVNYGASATGDGSSYVVVKSMSVADGSAEFFTKGIYTHNNITTNNDKTDHTQDGTWTVSEPGAYSFESIMNNTEDLNLGGYAETGLALPIAQDDYTSMFGKGQYLFLLPPAGADGLSEDGIKLEVVYDIVTIDSKLAAGYSVTESTYEVSLPAATLKQGKAYNYQLNFDVTEILVDANIVDWDDDNANVEGGVVDPFDKEIVNPIETIGIDANADGKADATAECYLGEELVLAPIITYEDGSAVESTDAIVWAQVGDEDLKLYANSADGTLTVSSDKVYEGAIITLTSASGKKAQIALTFKAIEFTATIPETIKEGESKDIDWSVNPDDTEVVWESSDETILTVDPATGELTGVTEGKATITAKDKNGNILKEQEVTVEAYAAPVVTDKDGNVLPDGSVIEFYEDETFEYFVETDGGITYTAVVTYPGEFGMTFLQNIEGNHVTLTGRKAGTGAILTITDQAGNVLTYTVNVLKRVVTATAVFIDGLDEFKFPSASSDKGETLTTPLSLTVAPNNTNKDYTWIWTIEDEAREGTAFEATVAAEAEDEEAIVSIPSFPNMKSTTLKITAVAQEDPSLMDEHIIKVLTPIGFDVVDPDKPGEGGGDITVVTPGLGDGGNTDL